MTRHPNQPHRPLLRTGLLVFFLMVLLLPRLVWATSCLREMNPARELQKSQAVFLGRAAFISERKVGIIRKGGEGKVIRVTTTIPIIPMKIKRYLVKFDVEKVWKGIEGKIAEVRFDYKNKFKKGRRYLVYAVDGDLGLEPLACRTKIVRKAALEITFLDKLAEGIEEKEIFEWLLTTALIHHERWIRKEALALAETASGLGAPDIPEGMEDALKDMAEDPKYEHRKYAQTILDKMKRSRENRKFIP